MAEQDISGLDELRRAMKSLKADPVILPSGVEIEDTRPIEPGDVVQLKSGGAKMTVIELGVKKERIWRNDHWEEHTWTECDGIATVGWLDDESRMQEATMPLAALERYKKLESPFAWAKYLKPTPLGRFYRDEAESDEEE